MLLKLLQHEVGVYTFAATWSKLESSWSTSVTVSPDDMRSTLTLTSTHVADCTQRALGVTLAFWKGQTHLYVLIFLSNLNFMLARSTFGSLMEQSRNAED